MTKEIAPELLEILACPLCKSDLFYDKSANELVCHQSKLAFKINDGVPILIIEDARKI